MDTRLEKAFSVFQNAISCKSEKTQNILANWIEIWSKYLSFEDSFDPSRLCSYKRGSIVLIEFGFNVGSELGGRHYAIVLENNNNPQSPVVVVAPIYSVSHGKTQETLKKHHVYIGKLYADSKVDSYVDPMQIRTVSKLRIITPKRYSQRRESVSSDVLNQIDAILIEKLTKQT